MVSCLLVIDNDFFPNKNYLNELFVSIISGPPEQAMWALGTNENLARCIL